MTVDLCVLNSCQQNCQLITWQNAANFSWQTKISFYHVLKKNYFLSVCQPTYIG